MKKTIKMDLSKSTKGTHVYSNNESDSPVSSLYIKKAGLSSSPPSNITLTLEYEVENIPA